LEKIFVKSIDKMHIVSYNKATKKTEEFLMKKIRTFLVASLAMLMMLVGLASCSLLQAGKYEATSYKFGPISVDLKDEESPSFVELTMGGDATVSISVAGFTWEGTGTWAKDDEGKDKTVDITVEGVTWEAKIDGSTMTLNVGVGSIVLEK
jgi:hypothetical protein